MVSSQLQLITLDGCDSCTLQREWPKLTHPKIPIIPPRFEHKTKVICIGEGPGATEDREGIPFVGESGRFLRNSMGIWQEKIYMTNIVRCRPPENRTPTDVEVECCSTYMFEDFTKIQPHALLLIGAPAVNAFWHGSETMPISKIRGIEFPVQLADDSWVWAFSTFHPSYVIRSERQYKENAVTPVFQNDLDYFFRNLDRYRTPPDIPAIPDEDEVCYPKTLLEVQNLFNRLIGDPGVDIETFMLKPYMRDARMLSAAFSDGETTFAFPVEWRNTGSWGLEAFLWCMQRVADLTWEWIAHNAGFELSWFWYYCKHFNWKFRDSAAKGRYVTKRSTLTSLANLSRIFLGVDIKTLSEVDVLRLEEFPMQKGLYYNAIDAWASKKLDSKIVMSPKQAENYDRAIKTTFSSTMMELLGIPVNLEESSRLQVELTKKDDHYNDIAQAIPAVQDYQDKNRKMFSLASPKDVGIVLHDYYGLKLEANKNGYCIDAEALEPNRGNALVDLRLDSQEVKKNLSTYVDSIATGAILGIDGWLHPSFTVLLTATNRLSSVNPNIQNWPKRKHKEIRRQVVPPKGYILVAFDYGGLEARGITIASNDRNLKKSFYNHEDIHAKWLNRFLQVYPDYKFRLAEKGNVSVDDYKAVWKSGRTIIKTDFVFASFYGAIVYSIANYTGLPQNIVEAVQSEFWLEYQGVQNWLVRQRQMYRETGSCETLTGLVRNEVMEGNEPINNPIQGLGAHIVLEAQNALCELSLEVDDIHLAPRWNVHDDLSFFLPDNNDLDLYIETIAREMTKPRFPFINVPLLVEGSAGPNWCDMEEFGKWEAQYYNDGRLEGKFAFISD